MIMPSLQMPEEAPGEDLWRRTTSPPRRGLGRMLALTPWYVYAVSFEAAAVVGTSRSA